MEQKIEIPSENYNFDILNLSTPINVQGGAYFTKLTNNHNDIFIQTPLCGSKQGIVKSGKRMYIDLLFDKTDDQIIMWFEKLEEKLYDMIYDKSDAWFQEPISKDDVETAFSPTIRLYRSGNYYLVRVFLDSPRMFGGSKNVSIYDDNEKELSVEDIKEDSKIICILHVHGVKFTSKSFQIYVQLKQAMVVTNNLFNQCRIRKNNDMNVIVNGGNNKKLLDKKTVEEIDRESNILENDNNENDNNENDNNENDNNDNNENDNNDNNDNNENDNILMKVTTNNDKCLTLEEEMKVIDDNDNVVNNIDNDTEYGNEYDNKSVNDDNDNIILDYEEMKGCISNVNKGLKEYEFDLDVNNMESIELRKPKEVYYEMYKVAREKAKESRKQSLQCYLESQNIKMTYDLDNLEDSSDEEYENQIYSQNINKNNSLEVLNK